MSTSDNQSARRPRRVAPSFAMLVLVSFCVLTIWQRIAITESAVDWRADLDAALVSAAAAGKPVLISFSSPGCGYCRKMEADILPQKEVLEQVRGFIPVKINVFGNLAVSARYNVDPLPTYVIADATGGIIARSEGYQSAAEFIRFLRFGAARAAEAAP